MTGLELNSLWSPTLPAGVPPRVTPQDLGPCGRSLGLVQGGPEAAAQGTGLQMVLLEELPRSPPQASPPLPREPGTSNFQEDKDRLQAASRRCGCALSRTHPSAPATCTRSQERQGFPTSGVGPGRALSYVAHTQSHTQETELLSVCPSSAWSTVTIRKYLLDIQWIRDLVS